MTSNSMRIPSKIKVGFNERKDTYTGKLAYVTYFDEKGVLRKESSWEGWRNKDIEPKEFTNEPVSGFVLNKGVGGARRSYGWNARNEYIRVYDPRDFEFEISVANLLFILEETSSIKGKGLEGEFVYAWDGKELVLLPTCSSEYEACSSFTKKLSNKLEKSEIKLGSYYLFKNETVAMYLGRHDVNEISNGYGDFRFKNLGKRHVFIKDSDIGKSGINYIFQSGYTNLAEKISDSASEFADEYEKLISSPVVCKNLRFSFEKSNLKFLDKDHFYYAFLLTKKDNAFYPTRLDDRYNWNASKNEIYCMRSKNQITLPENMVIEEKENRISLGGNEYFSSNHSYWSTNNSHKSYEDFTTTKEKVLEEDLYELVIYTEKNHRIGVNRHE